MSRFFNRDISWLGFNYRVLQEAEKNDVPLYERIAFLAIYSSNLDEFFRVRYPVLALLNDTPSKEYDSTIAKEVSDIIKTQLPLFGKILTQQILPTLKENRIHLYYNAPLSSFSNDFTKNYFLTKVLSFLTPKIMHQNGKQLQFENNSIYLFVTIERNNKTSYAFVNVPDKHLSRFVELPQNGDEYKIVFLEDIIRDNLDILFPRHTIKNCSNIKITRNADINIVDEWSDLFEEQVIDMIKKREKGAPTRLLYEDNIDPDALQFLKKHFSIKKTSLITGGRYHNLKDLSKLPNPLNNKLKFPKQIPIQQQSLSKSSSIFNEIEQSDKMLHLPYHSYDPILRFFNEASVDQYVEEINVTLYRVAADSYITTALMSAASNGKKVTAFVELKARFDEDNNIRWAKKMKAAGVNIVYSIPGIKVHVKLAIVKRKSSSKATYYSLLSTGNFNESTARFYTDHILITSSKNITTEVDLLFTYLKSREHPEKYQYLTFDKLIVAGFNLSNRFEELVNKEITNAQNGKTAHIIIKLNNLQEKNIIELLYKASNAGVTIDLIVRGICCLIPGVKGMSENINVRRIVGRYLEHSRVFIFNDRSEVYIGSADLMNRNIHRRIEVIFPIEDIKLKSEVLDIINLQLKDNTQSTILQQDGTMSLTRHANEDATNAQLATYNYVSLI